MEDTRSPLYESHAGQGASFIQCGEHMVPGQFDDAEEEYRGLTENAVLVDCCTEGRFKISGENREAWLDDLVTRPLKDIPINGVRTMWMLNDQGSIVDEVEIFRAENFLTLHCGMLMRRRVGEWLKEQAADADGVEVVDNTGAQGRVEIRGPRSRAMLETVLMDGDPPAKKDTATIVQIGQARCLVTWRKMHDLDVYRVETGGLFLKQMWDRLISMGDAQNVRPAGWQALEMYRIEQEVPGAGAEFDELTTPIEVNGLSLVSFQKPSFRGKRALLHSTVAEFSRRMVALQFQSENIPASGDPIEIEEVPLGYVSSSAFSPKAQCAVALGFVDVLKTAPGLSVQVRGEKRVLGATILEEVEHEPV